MLEFIIRKLLMPLFAGTTIMLCLDGIINFNRIEDRIDTYGTIKNPKIELKFIEGSIENNLDNIFKYSKINNDNHKIKEFSDTYNILKTHFIISKIDDNYESSKDIQNKLEYLSTEIKKFIESSNATIETYIVEEKISEKELLNKLANKTINVNETKNDLLNVAKNLG